MLSIICIVKTFGRSLVAALRIKDDEWVAKQCVAGVKCLHFKVMINHCDRKMICGVILCDV